MSTIDANKLVDTVLFGDIHEVPLHVLDGVISDEFIDDWNSMSTEQQTRASIAATIMNTASCDGGPSVVESKKLLGELYNLTELQTQTARQIDTIKKKIRADLLGTDVVEFAELSPYHLMIDFCRMSSAKKRLVELAKETDDARLWYVIDIINVIESQGTEKGLRKGTVPNGASH